MAGQVWRGLPVPWVVRWSADPAGPGLGMCWRGERLSYRDELPGDRRFGVLWHRDRIGHGRPQFATVHTGRHLAAMTDRRCQVCGGTAVGGDGRIGWLIPCDEWDPLNRPAGPLWTVTPPCCRACRPIALRLCPHLRSVGAVAASVARVRPAAVHGDAYEPGRLTPRELNLRVPLPAEGDLPHLLGKLLVVELDDVRLE
ncbi:hypothetical protein [Nonomuraea jiangxiensis]|uniref:Uncharacterized protein n=1 Tax=Nonomuraea jiangxiensis TaxID=633440 RepID=A0A1G9P8V7_9ACTN|nr:hypothetical protein [Nonomuraea jiangxiensis]SDL94993.1 hypothetical protein SAMN05421869_13365 [Nonomuraea jiangxiensis]